MKRITRAQAYYLYRKWKNDDISEQTIHKIVGEEIYIDLFGGWFVDFSLDELMEGL